MNASAPFEHFGKNLVVVLSLLAAGFFAAWLRFSPHLGSTGEFTDGVRQYNRSAEEPIRYAVWKEAERLAGALNDGEAEHRPALSEDGRWLVFVSGERGTNSDLWLSELVKGAAQEPRSLYELNSSFDELSPAFAGNALYFASNRPGHGGFDLWRARLNALGEFSAPEALPDSINSKRDELDPAPLPGDPANLGGTALAFASNRNMAGRRGHDFYLALPSESGDYLVEPLDSLNSWQDDRELSFTADGRRAFFASDRKGAEGAADYDLYASLKDHGQWLPPEALVGLNTPAEERGPAPNRNGLELLFERREPVIPGEDSPQSHLFRATTLEIFQRPGPRVGWLDLLILIALLVMALLAFLAKRWDAIEVLYKCFLVSLIVHGCMLYWFRDIHPESELQEFPKSSPAYQVKLIPRASAIRSRSEQGGVLEVRRSPSTEATPPEPERLPSEVQARSISTEQQVPNAPSTSSLTRAQAPDVLSAAQPVAWQPSASAASPRGLELADAPELQRLALDQSAASASQEPRQLEVVAQHATVEIQTEGKAPARPNVESPLASGVRATARALEKEGRRPLAPSPSAGTPIPERTPFRLGAMANAQELRDPQASSGDTTAKRALSRGNDANELPTAAALELSKSWAEGSQPEAEAQRLNMAPASGPSTHVEPERMGVEAQLARSVSNQGPSSPGHEFSTARPTQASLPDVPLPLANPSLAFERRALSTATGASPQANLPAPERFGRQRKALATATPSRHGLGPSVLPAAAILPPSAPVAPDQRMRPAPLPEPALAKFEHTPYRTRFGPAKARALEEHGGNQETEAAVAAGLGYLAGVQRPDGSWGPGSWRSDKYGEVRVGKTGLCLLAFLGAGHTSTSETQHSEVASSAIRFLLGTQNQRTGHFGATSSYGHGIATYALAESFALTNDPGLREPLQRAVQEILRHQQGDGRDSQRHGGWGYYGDEVRRQDKWPRASISAWQVMALESARLAGLHVPDRAFAAAKSFLIGCVDPRRGAFRYSHDPSRLNGAYAILPGSTPASLFALSLLEVDLEAPEFQGAWQFLADRRPEAYDYRGDDAFVYEAHGNLYFWYYGSLASMRRGGSTWKRWNVHLQETLLPAQRSDGSWEPISTYARDYARDGSRDASYSTAMNVLSLEVYYRYFTPLLKVGQSTAPATAR